MALVNLSQAAKMAEVTRQTLYKHIKDGLISKTTFPDGSPAIDTAEILRHYGSLSHDSLDSIQVVPDGLQREVDGLRLELKAARELLVAKDAHIDTLKKALLMLENIQPATQEQTPAPTPKRTFMQKFFGWND